MLCFYSIFRDFLLAKIYRDHLHGCFLNIVPVILRMWNFSLLTFCIYYGVFSMSHTHTHIVLMLLNFSFVSRIKVLVLTKKSQCNGYEYMNQLEYIEFPNLFQPSCRFHVFLLNQFLFLDNVDILNSNSTKKNSIFLVIFFVILTLRRWIFIFPYRFKLIE